MSRDVSGVGLRRGSWKERPANVTDMVTERHDVGSQTELRPLYHPYRSNSFWSTCLFSCRLQRSNSHLDRPSSSRTIYRMSQKPYISDIITNTSHIVSYCIQASQARRSDSEYTKIYTKKWCIEGETKGKFLAAQMPQNFAFSQKGSLANYFANSNKSGMKESNHCTVKVWFIAFRSVCHEGELRDAEDVAVYVFDARPP